MNKKRIKIKTNFMLLIAFAILLVRLVIALSPALQQLLQILWQQTKQVLRKKKTARAF
ncbi:MAG: hypothetical protein V9E96_06855 [Chitinophagaceae bacterium]